MWVTLPNNADWDCFKTLTSQEILKIRSVHLGGTCAFLEVIRLFQQIECARNRHQFLTTIISLDTGLRLDGLPALESWDLIVSVRGNVSRVSERLGNPENEDHKSHKSENKIDKKLYCVCSKTMKQ